MNQTELMNSLDVTVQQFLNWKQKKKEHYLVNKDIILCHCNEGTS